MGLFLHHFNLHLRSHVLHWWASFKILDDQFRSRLSEVHVGRMVSLQALPTGWQSLFALALDSSSRNVFDTTCCSFHNNFQDQEESGVHADGSCLLYFDDHQFCHIIRSRSDFRANKNFQPAKRVLSKLSDKHFCEGWSLLLWTYLRFYDNWGPVKSRGKEPYSGIQTGKEGQKIKNGTKHSLRAWSIHYDYSDVNGRTILWPW